MKLFIASVLTALSLSTAALPALAVSGSGGDVNPDMTGRGGVPPSAGSGSRAKVRASSAKAIDLYVDGVYQDTYQTEDEARKAAIDWRSQGATPLCVYDEKGIKAPCPKLEESQEKTRQRASHRGSGRFDPRRLDDQASRAIVFFYQPV